MSNTFAILWRTIRQAIERLDDPFALGVQWHPEHLFYSRRQRAMFRALVAAAAARRGNLQN